MKVTIIGATGRVGSSVVRKLANVPDIEVFAGARQVEKVPRGVNITPFKIDLHISPELLNEELPDSDAIIFAAGSGGKDLLQVDLNGAVKVMRGAEHKGIKRFIMLSARNSLNLESFSEPNISPIANYLIAKHYADKWLMNNTDLDFTILQPTTLTEEPATGKITIGQYASNSNTIDDVAETLIAILKNDRTIRKVIAMSNGDTPIEDAVFNL
ncbi:NAD(P)H-binding protein [Lentilactobacillus kosonis]|uniref:Predicted nucleoside-diphosphate-sugar epimerase n=1 Tax=Lentilactobacillus kosonis TaxID=2810561 RepID=A0A401FIW5_9LACO|nr:NAD(P)H-binding protein [Lentilactobacillus kosonis]GAY72302.1 predicted nucleoside-diphosphate-sugar epimerase [Lentilactobacillus kosonis]